MYTKVNVMQKDGVTPSTMFRAQVLKPAHFALVQEIVKFNGGEPLISLKNLWAAHMALRQRKYGPYFITKNVACKTKTAGIYDLSKLRASTKPEPVKPAKPTKKEKKPKLEASKKATKKGKKTPAVPVQEPVEAAISETPVEATL